MRRSSASTAGRSEEHTSELQSRLHLVCRLLLEKTQSQRDAPWPVPSLLCSHAPPRAQSRGGAVPSRPPVRSVRRARPRRRRSPCCFFFKSRGGGRLPLPPPPARCCG